MAASPPRPFERAVILAVGSELLGAERLDINSLTMTAALNRCGIDLVWKAVAGDDRAELTRAVRRALDDADLVLVCGGLGPTDDDLTREVVGGVLGRTLHTDPAIADAIAARFAARGWTMADNNRRQAQVPEGAMVLPNARGTAPGLWIEDGPAACCCCLGRQARWRPCSTTRWLRSSSRAAEAAGSCAACCA